MICHFRVLRIRVLARESWVDECRRNMVTSPEKMVTFADDTVLEAALGGELYECSAKLYARHRHRRSLTSHGSVLAGAGGRFFRPVVASFTLSHFEAT